MRMCPRSFRGFYTVSFLGDLKKDFCPCNLSSEELVYEQHKALAKLLPSLYVAGITSIICLIALNMNTAPAWVILYLPGFALLFSFWRFWHWMKVRQFFEDHTFKDRQKDIWMVIIMSPVLSLYFSFLAIMLMQYGELHTQALSAILLWGTVGVAGYAMSSVPLASMASVLASSVPMAGAFLMSRDNVLSTVSIGYISLSLLTVYILFNSYRAFASLVHSRSELKEKHAKVHKLAYSDHLTGLANRQMFRDELIRKVKDAEALKRKMAVFILDLDGFRHVNNLFNHEAGDQVLVEAGQRLEKLIGVSGLVARLSSNEFHIQAYRVTTEDEAEKLGHDIHNALRAPFYIEGKEIRISASIGVALYPEAGTKPSQLVKRAAQAQKKAKVNGGGKTRIFTMDFEKDILERSRLLIDLKSAIEKDEIEVYFQPIVNLQTGRYAGFETLARWVHPERGFVPPDVFISLAEEKGLIEPLTVNLLRKAAAVAATWPSDIKVAFNFSAEQVCNPNFALTILAILNEAGLPPHRFEAELTETAVMRDMQGALRMVENLRQVGISISLDDFGTGYSSLSQIKDLPLNKLKIDKSFVDDVCTSKKMHNIIKTILGLCSVLDLHSVCEGIETREQMEALKAAGGHLGQGYLFSRPVPACEISDRFFFPPLMETA